ncbi:MAG: hypothetical protein ACRDGS_02390, partial [Chloroflexota bacterium]
ALEWWAVRLAFQIVDISSTGHASAHDLGLIAAHCGVPIVLSIHSMHPELMPIPAAQLMLPERGRTYDIARFG